MAKYYFVTTFLPALKIGLPPELEWRELDFLLKLNLTKGDLQKVSALKRYSEIENIRAFWAKLPFESDTMYDEKEIEEQLLHLTGYPLYVFEYMEKYEDTPSRIAHFPELLRSFFQQESKAKDPFVKNYIEFEYHTRLVLQAIRAKSLGRDLEGEFRYEDPEDPFVREIILQAEQKSYEPPAHFQLLKGLYETKKEDPLELQKALSEWQFEEIEHMVGDHPFDIQRVLGYVLQLSICEKWMKLDKKKGLELVEQIAKGTS